MTDAPERIWMLKDATGPWFIKPVQPSTEYIRADLARADKEAAVMRALEADTDGFGTLVFEAKAEAEKAMRKFPQPNYVISKIAEEAGEVVKAAIHCAEGRETPENVRGEMKQLIAMLYRLWVEGDQVHGLAAIRALAADPAAMALHDALLPGWVVGQIGQVCTDGTGGWNVWITAPDYLSNCVQSCAKSDTPARAWLLAILRAYRQQVTEQP